MLRKAFVCAYMLYATLSFAQHSISGKITNEENQALVGANVILNNSNIGAVTDYEGNYEFKNLAVKEYKLSISYVGYVSVYETVNLKSDVSMNFSLIKATINGEEIIVKATRATATTPVTYSVVNKEDIEKRNLGQDLPYLLGLEPSLVTSSDAGSGVGYTGMWIRGSNIQRINVTVNGIPLNDPESHSVFWVNMPDFASSIESAQIQRGVGTSTNGGGAFGATINLETNQLNKLAFGEISSSFGSFNTMKNNAQFGTGLIKSKWAFEGRISKIKSDGYIDRAASELSSVFLQGGYYTENTTVKAVFFTGKEKTYQAWWGADQWTIDNLGRTYNWAGVIYNNDGSTSYYDNQTDNYQQDHYQLHLSQKLAERLKFNASLHYTYGRGYYEEYYQGESLANYPIGNQYFGYDSTMVGTEPVYFFHDTITSSDIIVRRWLDNHFYGGTFSFNYQLDNLDVIIGGAINKYGNAKHFGEMIWSQYTSNTNIRDKYYESVSNKLDGNVYAKANWQVTSVLSLFGDLQYRGVSYIAKGFDNDSAEININKQFHFFNPKLGFSYQLPNLAIAYVSYAVANREPVRTDYTDAPEGVEPKPELLGDLELGIRKRSAESNYGATLFLMNYSNQLVLTGEINDVGSPIRANVGTSYRLGIEVDGGIRMNKYLAFRANLSLSENKTNYKETQDSVIKIYDKVQIAYSPAIIGGAEIELNPIKNFTFALLGKYVGRSYLDNTGNKDRSLNPYFINDIRIAYSLKLKALEEIQFSLQINNVMNVDYMSNGYLWETTPYYFPQAGINFMAGINLRF